MSSCNNREPVNSLWIGQRVSKLEQLCMRSFMAHGHPFHLYVYDDIEGIPEGVHLKDGNEVISEPRFFPTHAKSCPPGQIGCAGPKTYSRALIHFGLGDFILYDEMFTSFREGDDFLKFFQPDPSACAIMENAYCIHAYNDMADRNGINKDGVFDETSPFDVLKKRYDIFSEVTQFHPRNMWY